VSDLLLYLLVALAYLSYVLFLLSRKPRRSGQRRVPGCQTPKSQRDLPQPPPR